MSERTRVLIANRGEIAVRVVRACRRIGFEAVVAVSEADRHSLAARLADRVVCIGPADPARSYLRPELLAQAAVSVGADVVHPGYGFCSEKPELGEMLAEEGIAFAGPRPKTLRAVGNKSSARQEAIAAGVPVSPAEDVQDVASARAAGERIGYPALLKAVHGGGGRGIHLVERPADLDRLVDLAAAEARAGFGDGALYLERYYADARHVEVQVFGDGNGGVLVVGDRDCSVQRRHQKVVEEVLPPACPRAPEPFCMTAPPGWPVTSVTPVPGRSSSWSTTARVVTRQPWSSWRSTAGSRSSTRSPRSSSASTWSPPSCCSRPDCPPGSPRPSPNPEGTSWSAG